MTYIPSGSLLFAPYNPDDYPTFVSNEGVYLGLPDNDPLFDTDGFGTVTQGVIQLDNGRLCVTNLGNYQNGVFNADMTLRATDPSDNPSSIAGGYDNGFFYGIRKDYPFNSNKLITKISSDTALTVATYNTAETVQDVFALAVARDESYAYYAQTAGIRPGDVIRLDLSTLAKTTFVTASGSDVTGFNGMFCLRDGTLMVAWSDGVIRHYSTAGALLHSYTQANWIAITPGLTDASFWVHYNTGTSFAQEIEVATGTLLHDFALPTGDPPAAHAGNVSSANWGQTFCVITVAIGTPPPPEIVEPPIPDEDPCTIKTPLYFAVIQPSEDLGDVLQGGQTELRDPADYYGGVKPALVLSIGNITRAASDVLTGVLPAQTASVVWADTRRFVRNVFGTLRSDFTSSPLWIYLTSRVVRAAQLIPRLLFYGFLYEDPISQDLTYTTNANDLVGKDYSLLGDEVLIPKRKISVDDFPARPSAVDGLGVPIIGGTVSNAAIAADAGAGAIKLIDVGDFTCQDTKIRRALLVCGHACQSITPYQNGDIPAGDYGVSIWAPGQTGWTDIVPGGESYVTINSQWFSLVFVSGKRALAIASDTTAIEVATVASGASALAFDVGSGEAAQFTAGEEIVIRLAANSSTPEIRTIDTIVSDTITVTEALSGTPAAGDEVRPSALPIDDGKDGAVYADVEGMTDVSDGSGTLITDLLLLDRHVLENFIFGDYTAGDWLDPPTFDFYPGGATSYLLDRDSWVTTSAIGASYMPGSPASPFLGGFVIGASGRRQSTRQVMADFARSGNFRRGWHGNNQFFVTMLDRNRTSFIGGRRTITDRIDILSNPRFAPTPMKDWLCNDLLGRYAANYRDDGRGDWNAQIQHGNAPSQLQYGYKFKLDTYPMVRDQDTANIVAQQRLDFFSQLRLVWTWGQSLCALQTSELLTGVAVTHYGGKSGTGFVDNAMWVDKQVCVPKTSTVLISAIDVGNLLSDES